MEKHIKIIAYIRIAFSILGIFAGAILFFILTGAGFLAEDAEAMVILSIVGTSLATFFLLISIPGLAGGIGLLYYKNWARVLIIIISIIDLINIPLGTALGGYSLWVLFNDEATQYFYPEQKKVLESENL